MRVILDANIIVSYLLSPDHEGCISEIVTAALLGRYSLLVPPGLADEVGGAVNRARYLAGRITAQQAADLMDVLAQAAISIPAIARQIPAIVRDSKDDYLIAYAVMGQADYLVTGDKDLLVIRQVGDLRIVSTHEFQAILRGAAAAQK